MTRMIADLTDAELAQAGRGELCPYCGSASVIQIDEEDEDGPDFFLCEDCPEGWEGWGPQEP